MLRSNGGWSVSRRTGSARMRPCESGNGTASVANRSSRMERQWSRTISLADLTVSIERAPNSRAKPRLSVRVGASMIQGGQRPSEPILGFGRPLRHRPCLLHHSGFHACARPLACDRRRRQAHSQRQPPRWQGGGGHPCGRQSGDNRARPDNGQPQGLPLQWGPAWASPAPAPSLHLAQGPGSGMLQGPNRFSSKVETPFPRNFR